MHIRAFPIKKKKGIQAPAVAVKNILLCAFQEKRSAFPRFYFIGDDDLLEILGQATNPTVIQSHLKKLFAGHFCLFIFFHFLPPFRSAVCIGS